MNQPMSNSAGSLQMNAMMNNMGMMPNMMAGMMMMGMKKAPMTEEQKKQLRMQGYLMGKKMAEERKKQNAAKNPTAPPTEEGPATGELSIKFNKGGSETIIKMNADSMVAELIDEYCRKVNIKTGTFKFNGNDLNPQDPSSLAEVGLKNNSVITVT